MRFACKSTNRPFPSSKKTHFQSEAKCEAIDMKMIFNYDANKTHFHNKGFALSLVLKVRFFGNRKWPISTQCTRVQVLQFPWPLLYKQGVEKSHSDSHSVIKVTSTIYPNLNLTSMKGDGLKFLSSSPRIFSSRVPLALLSRNALLIALTSSY